MDDLQHGSQDEPEPLPAAQPAPLPAPVPSPQYAPAERIGDAEREKAVTALSEHYALGRLDAAELDTRLEAAYRATTLDQLRSLFADLPDPVPFKAPRAARRRPERPPAMVRRGFGFPVVPVLVTLAVVLMVVTEGRAFFVFPLLWFWMGFGRRMGGPPHHHPRP